MVEGWLRSGTTVVHCVMAWLGATSVAESSARPSTAMHRSIVEIDPGDGPAWGTMSGLTAHPIDASRLFAVIDKDSPPVRILELEVLESTARVVRQIRVFAPGFDGLDPEAIVAKADGGWPAAAPFPEFPNSLGHGM